MCNFMGYRVSRADYIRLKEIEKQFGSLAALDALRSGFEYTDWECVREMEDSKDIEVVKMHWEFIPSWIKDMDALKEARKKGIPWLNAKAETLLESKMFRPATLKRRCLVVASWFYEWRHYKPEGAKKEIAYPYLVEVPGQEYFYMAGIWQPWTDKSTGETIDTFAIVTTAANSLMKAVHNKKERMPTILPEDIAADWINKDLSEERVKEIAAYQFPSEKMFAKTIHKDFKLREDPTEAFAYNELPEIVLE